MKAILALFLLALPCHAQVSATAAAGQRVTISATADGTPPFSYQWYKMLSLTSVAGMEIAGETGPSYVIPSVKAADAGTYFATVSNPASGGNQSDTATLTVNPMLATLTASIVNVNYPAPVIYQWRLNGKSIPGGNTPTYSFDPAVAPGSYSVSITFPNPPPLK